MHANRPAFSKFIAISSNQRTNANYAQLGKFSKFSLARTAEQQGRAAILSCRFERTEQSADEMSEGAT